MLEVYGWEISTADFGIVVGAAIDEVVFYSAEQKLVCWCGLALRFEALCIAAVFVSTTIDRWEYSRLTQFLMNKTLLVPVIKTSVYSQREVEL